MSYTTDLLKAACENEANTNILNFTNDKIMKVKVDIINELPINHDAKVELIEKLQSYMYVDEIHELKNGAYLRWLDMRDIENIRLVSGAFFCELVFTDSNSCMRMKNIRGRHFEVKMDDVILFQKLSDQEKVILAALSYMSK